MEVVLTKQLEQYIAQKMSTGAYSCPSDVIRDGLRMLMERDLVLETCIDQLKRGLRSSQDQPSGEDTQIPDNCTLCIHKLRTLG